jgi:hypothetical protein
VAAYVLICGVALLVAALTLFSGFGLGTLLMPAFALFLPVQVAIAATALVHLANNLFKLGLVARHANWRTVALFGIPAALASLAGALLLDRLGELPALHQYELFGATHRVMPLQLLIGLLMIGFAVIELHPRFDQLAFSQRWIPLGGVLSGFFGGLSGHQGALRAAFLVRAKLTKESFVGTTAVCSVVVDVTRLVVYGATVLGTRWQLMQAGDGLGLVIAGSLAAFVGSFIGLKLVKKVTLRTIQVVVGIMLLLLGTVIAAGLLPER